MTGRRHDIVIAGGGLSGGLIALALRRTRPELDVVLLEAGEQPGGNHRWSWFATDLDPAGADLLAKMRTTGWSDGYDVAFPGHRRTLGTPYRSLASSDFAAALVRELAPGAIRCKAQVDELRHDGVVLAGGASRRMGRDKATMAHPGGRGITMVEHIVAVLASCCSPVFAVHLVSDLLHGQVRWVVHRFARVYPVVL